MKYIKFFLILLLGCIEVYAQGFTDLEKIKLKLYQEAFHNFSPSEESIDKLLSKMKEDGKWTDINYKDQSLAGWEPRDHWSRLWFMSKHYNDNNSIYYKNEDLLNAILNGINFWLSNPPNARNWWFNCIGVPNILGPVFLLMEDHLTSEQKEKGTELMKIGVKPTHYALSLGFMQKTHCHR